MNHNGTCKNCGRHPVVTVDELCARCTVRNIARAMRAEGATGAADTILALCDNDVVGQGVFERALLGIAHELERMEPES